MIIFITLTNLIVGLLQFDCDHPHHRTLIEFELSDNVLGHREQTRTGVCEKKHSSGEQETWDSQFTKHQLRGWIAVPAAVLQVNGSRETSVLFTDTGSNFARQIFGELYNIELFVICHMI